MKNQSERGTSLIEVLVSMSILAIVGLAVANSTIRSYVFMKQSTRASLASQLALDKIEMMATVDPSTLTELSGGTETGVTRKGVSFNRTTTVAVNTDGSRTITVNVVAPNGVGGRAVFTSTFAQWGNT